MLKGIKVVVGLLPLVFFSPGISNEVQFISNEAGISEVLELFHTIVHVGHHVQTHAFCNAFAFEIRIYFISQCT